MLNHDPVGGLGVQITPEVCDNDVEQGRVPQSHNLMHGPDAAKLVVKQLLLVFFAQGRSQPLEDADSQLINAQVKDVHFLFKPNLQKAFIRDLELSDLFRFVLRYGKDQSLHLCCRLLLVGIHDSLHLKISIFGVVVVHSEVGRKVLYNLLLALLGWRRRDSFLALN